VQLIEVLMTLIIIGILSTVGLPAYTEHIASVKRIQATQELNKLAVAMETYHIEHQSYRDASLESLHFNEWVADGQYRIEIRSESDDDYELVATGKDNHEKITLNAN